MVSFLLTIFWGGGDSVLIAFFAISVFLALSVIMIMIMAMAMIVAAKRTC